MRLDLFLKLSRLEPRRSVAQQMCEAGAVTLNGARAKSAHTVRAGDQIAIRKRGRIITVRVVDIPSRPPSKAEAASLYELVSDEAC
ncbi:MAG TPA: RNA-binding S4 domain-containing protein [Blastocatellia bacterium]|nr:RNA-binding S4 domain-containing protein [Blastocatellia bacterium]